MAERLISELEMIQGPDFCFGRGVLDPMKKYYWSPDDSKKTINPHLLIVGGSGAGKTRLLKKIATYLGNIGKKVVIIDFHGDISVPGEIEYKFTARNSRYGLSPFEFEHDEENGGINMQARILAATFKRSFIKNMGDKQKSVLIQFIKDCYAYVGIYDKDVSTWSKPLPTIKTMHELYSQIFLAINSKQGKVIDKELEFLTNLKGKADNSFSEEEKEDFIKKIDKKFNDLENLISKFYLYLTEDKHKELFNLKINNVDISWYLEKDNAKVFKSLAPYIKEIHSSPVFNENKPPSIKKGITRYNLSGHTNIDEPSEAIFLADIIQQRIFRAAKLRGEYRNTGKTGVADIYIITDESKLILPTGSDKNNPYHILNRIVTEARKFGLGWIGASQRPNHFPEEMVSSIGTKVVLQINRNDISSAIKYLGVQNDRVFQQLENKGVALVGQIGKNFHPVALPWAELKR